MNYRIAAVQSVNLGETSYFSLKKGSSIKYKLVAAEG